MYGPGLLVTLGVSSDLDHVLRRLREGSESFIERLFFPAQAKVLGGSFSENLIERYHNQVVSPLQALRASFEEIESTVFELSNWSDVKSKLAESRFSGWLHIGHSEKRGFQVAGPDFITTKQLTQLLSISSIELFDLRTCQNNLQVREIRNELPHLVVLGTGRRLDVDVWLEICTIFAVEMKESGDDYYVASQRVLIEILNQISPERGTT